ncbi:MAG: MFS transporter [Phenylobacterium sp.]|uniref:MFS transporter n=1 Tax=Phenylobacterium sp. TaxID=1871053 RepID=UPI0025EE1F4A|nr:MFS transporter [Phenylobacterium sp.]MBI1199925.1 MFS transporter [Phenylobacterium sp.]
MPAADAPMEAEIGGDGRLNRGGVAWAVFEGGRDPYVILITIYIFMPYVAASMVGDPVRGQELISRFQQYVGWIVMATAPFLGASIDKLGPRKGWLALIVAAMVPLIGALWFARPDQTGLSIIATMSIALVVNVLFTYSEVLHNSLLVRAAGLSGAHRASGLALSLGNGASVLALAFTAWAFALPGKVSWSWVPAQPLFGLDPATHEPERVVAILAAGVLALGAIPLFLFTPDAPKTGVSIPRAFAQGARDLWGMLRTVGRYRDAVVYLASRMLFVDGMNGVLFFFGVLAAGVMKWGPLELLAAGITMSVMAVLGGLVGRWLDEHLGPKTALRIEIFMTILGLIALLGMKEDRILYFWAYDAAAHGPLWDGPVFTTLPSLIFLLIGFSNAVFITGQYASSRTALTRLTPPEQTGAFFGVYALSGVATAWLAPGLVNIGTRITHSQQGGFASIVVLLAAGLAGLFLVRGGGPRRGAGA